MTTPQCVWADMSRRGTTYCRRPATVHQLITVDHHGRLKVHACIDCAVAVAVRPVFNAQLLAQHPLTPACRHPDGQWDDDGCVIPTVDDVTVDQLTDVEVPA